MKAYLSGTQISRLNRELPESEKLETGKFGAVIDTVLIKSETAKKIAEEMMRFNQRPQVFWHKKWNGF